MGGGAALLHSGLEKAAAEVGDRTALNFEKGRVTYSELGTMADNAAGYLADRGMVRGDRLFVMLGTSPDFVSWVLGASKIGGAAVLVNPSWRDFEVGHAVDLTEPVLAVGDETTLPVLRGRLPADQLVDASNVTPEPTTNRGEVPDPDDDCLLVFSSGTTGLPKAARHTHRSMAHAIDHWVTALGLGPEDRFQIATPPSHILGLLNLVTAIAVGATVRLHRRFDLDRVLACIERDRMTLEMAVAPIALAMANHPDLERYDLSSLRYIMWGATPVTASVAETVTRRTGVRWLPAYGATELPVLAANPVGRPDEWRLDSAGLPPSGVELRVVDLDTGAPVANGQTGEIQARSPSVMAGYLPDSANEAAYADGWYRTGDVGWIEPEGWVHLTDRAKEMIKVNGFQVAPAEIEAVLLGHPSVVDCAVFGIPDASAGEVPVAAIQLHAERAVDPDELADLVAASLAPYKRLRRVVVVDAIPRLPSGKALRRQLRDEWS